MTALLIGLSYDLQYSFSKDSEIKGLQSPFPNLYYPGAGIELKENLTSTVLFSTLFPFRHYNFFRTVEFPGYRIGNTSTLHNKRNYGPWSVPQVNGQLKSLARHKQLCQASHCTATSGEGFPTWPASLWLEWIGFQRCPLFTSNKREPW